jgi:hypothetical protein
VAKKRSGSKAPVGSGKRFTALKGQLARKGVRNPGALAASIGRKKYGKAQFQAMSAAGRKRAGKRRRQ